jgi:hypothetical protein
MTLGRSGRTPSRKARLLATASYSNFVRLTPKQNVKLGFSPKARHYALRGTKRVTKATPTISARQFETKRASELFGLTPEKATEARRHGVVSYVSADQRERVADPEKPYRGKKLHTSAHIRIYDVFGFFQSSFSAVVDSMVSSGHATKKEADFIAKMKEKRDQFANEDIEQIKAYTTLELRLLAQMMGGLRVGFEETGLHLRHWHGAGAAASALIESQKLKMHYGLDIAAVNISPQQTAAHHAYYGGRIELLKQGYVENRALHVYDIASAYPAAMIEFPSLAGGEWVGKSGTEFAKGSLSDSRAAVEAASCLSMFKIRFQFPTYERYDPDARKAVFIPFYPLPYRDKRGGILFPPSGYGWYNREEALGAISWLERFVPD